MVTIAMKLKDAFCLKKSYDQPRQHIKKQRHHFDNKGSSSQNYGFSNSHVRHESWTIKKAECRRIDAFELWCLSLLLRVPWTARKSNQSILKESTLNIHWKDWCWSRSSNALAIWCKETTHWKNPWCWERLRAKGEGGGRGRNGCMVSLTQWTWVWANLRDSKGQGSLACCSLCGHKEWVMT